MRINSSLERRSRVVQSGTQSLDFNLEKVYACSSASKLIAVMQLSKQGLRAFACSPQTPVAELVDYRQNIVNLHGAMQRTLSNVPVDSLVMGDFARASNTLVRYINALPSDCCVGSDNQGAFDALNASLSSAVSAIQAGTTFFENNFERFVNRAAPLLNSLSSACASIDSAARDFRGVIDAFELYKQFAESVTLDIWRLSVRIEETERHYADMIRFADQALNRALDQIQTNVEVEANRFVSEERTCEAAFKQWDEKRWLRRIQKIYVFNVFDW